MGRTRIVLAALAATIGLTGISTATAQGLTTPTDWRWRLDRPAFLVTGENVPDSAWRFVGMPPGFHVTTGPGVVLYNPKESASGRFSLVSDFVLFPNPSDNAYGLVLGADDLGLASGSRIAVQLRRDGAIRVKADQQGVEKVLAPWNVHKAVRIPAANADVTNRLRVTVSSDSLRVFVNDSAVVTVGTAGLRTDGQFGFIIGDRLNLHITTLDQIRHLAPPRRGREE